MSQDDFAQRVALVTGASGGIGADLSVRLAHAGAAVGVHYASNRDAAERVVATIAAAGGRAAAFAADLREADAPELLVDAVEVGNRLLAQDENGGALPTLYAATADIPSKSFAGPGGFMEQRGAPKLVGPSSGAKDTDVHAASGTSRRS